MTAVRTSAMPPATCMVLPDGLEFDHGLTLTSSSPVTRCSRNKLNAADTTAPAAIAAHDTEETLDSSGMTTTSDVTVDLASFSAPGMSADTPALRSRSSRLGSTGARRSAFVFLHDHLAVVGQHHRRVAKSFHLERSGTGARFR